MENLLSGLLGLDPGQVSLAIMMKMIFAIGGLLYTGIKSLKFVNEGEEGIKLRFGKAVRRSDGMPKIIKPGILVLIPFVENLRKRHVRQQTIQFNDVQVVINQKLPFIVDASLIFRVNDIYKALFEVNSLESNIRDYGSHVLYSVISELKEDNIYDLEKISQTLLMKINEKAGEWGIEFIFFNLNSIRPTAETANYMTIGPITEARVKTLVTNTEEIKKIGIDPVLAATLIGYQLTPIASSKDNSKAKLISKTKNEKETK